MRLGGGWRSAEDGVVVFSPEGCVDFVLSFNVAGDDDGEGIWAGGEDCVGDGFFFTGEGGGGEDVGLSSRELGEDFSKFRVWFWGMG